jgi:hypothetical protein
MTYEQLLALFKTEMRDAEMRVDFFKDAIIQLESLTGIEVYPHITPKNKTCDCSQNPNNYESKL